MRIINDTEVFEPSECYFCISTDPELFDGEAVIYITSISYWKENHCLDGNFGDHSFTDKICNKLESKGIYNLMEATWGGDLDSEEEIRKTMLELGFVENPDMITLPNEDY